MISHSNATATFPAAPLHHPAAATVRGEQASNTPGATHPSRGSASTGLTRPRGVVHSRRPALSPQQREHIVEKIRLEQRAAGIAIDRHEVPGNRASAGGIADQITSWLRETARNIDAAVSSALPTAWGADAAPLPPDHGGIVHMAFSPHNTGYGPHEAGSEVEVGKALQQIFPADQIHTLDAGQDCAFIYPRNLAACGPRGLLVTDAYKRPEIDCARAALITYVRNTGIPYVVIDDPITHKRVQVNFANVEWIPDKGVLVLADVDDRLYRALVSAYDRPERVVSVLLDADARDLEGTPACYDLDLGFHAVQAPDGTWVAMVHEPCFKRVALNTDPLKQSRPQATTFSDILRSLGFKVIPISTEDQRLLATNAISSPDHPSRLLMTDQRVSQALVEQLESAGVTPVFDDKVLGYGGGPLGAPYGIHCLTLHIPAPRTPQTPGSGDDAPAKDQL